MATQLAIERKAKVLHAAGHGAVNTRSQNLGRPIMERSSTGGRGLMIRRCKNKKLKVQKMNSKEDLYKTQKKTQALLKNLKNNAFPHPSHLDIDMSPLKITSPKKTTEEYLHFHGPKRGHVEFSRLNFYTLESFNSKLNTPENRPLN